MEQPEDLISPMKLAKKLDVRPQQIYGLLRRGSLKEYTDERGKKCVSEDEVRMVLENSVIRRKKRDEDGEIINPYPEGTLLVWEIRLRVGMMEEENWLDYVRDNERKHIIYDRVRMNRKVHEGIVQVAEPRGVLDLVAASLEVTGKDEAALELRHLVKKFEEDLGDSLPEFIVPDEAAVLEEEPEEEIAP